jgi:hypothetical protein
MAEKPGMTESEKPDPDEANEIDPLTGAVRSDGREYLDFAASIVLFGVCIFSGILAYGYYVRSGKIFYASPGLMPIIIAGSLFIFSLNLFVYSIKGSSVKVRVKQLIEAVPRGLKSKRFLNSAAALGMFWIYIFFLLKFLPFWLASLILLIAVFIYLKASSVIKCILIGACSIGGIVLLFQVAFRVPLP